MKNPTKAATAHTGNKAAEISAPKGKANPVIPKKVSVNETMTSKLEDIETADQLKRFVTAVHKKRMKLFRRNSNIPLVEFDKVKGKTRADAIRYNGGKVRVCLMHKYFVVGNAAN